MPTFGAILSPYSQQATKLDPGLFNNGRVHSKTQRQATIDKNYQIQAGTRNQGAGMSNSSKVTLNPNNKHGVTLSLMPPESVATMQSRNHN